MSKALLFLNGKKPCLEAFSTLFFHEFSLIIATDGAYNYLKNSNVPLQVVIGDFDSVHDDIPTYITKIVVQDQDSTDFEKALDYLISQNIKYLTVYGSSGQEQDHFLGNLTAALQYKDKIVIHFFDEFHEYFLADKTVELHQVLGKKISLFPFPKATGITTKGLQYALQEEDLDIHTRIGIRNKAIEKTTSIDYKSGNLIIFIER